MEVSLGAFKRDPLSESLKGYIRVPSGFMRVTMRDLQ